jgi:NitT/TauT family transport system ATP-binding protein
MISPANTSGTSKFDDAIIMTLPMPRFDATVSEITVPTKASVTATFKEAKKNGMLQRASLCRALIHEPQLLMLDEPFGALDQFTREELWAIMQELWMKLKPTVVLVTHDLKEAGYLATRICVMATRPGRIVDDAAVPFPRPRNIEMSYLPEFVSMTQRLRQLIVSARPAKETVQ